MTSVAATPRNDNNSQPIGLVGVGLMGTAIAGRLRKAGLDVLGYDVDTAAADRLHKLGVEHAADVAEIAKRCAIVVLAVFDTAQVEDVVAGPAGLTSVPADKRRTRIVLNTSTCEPDRVAALAQRVAADSLALVELPVSGTSDQVARGDGVGLVAGDPQAADAAAQVIAAICPRTFFMGAAGNGGRTKLAINLILGLNRAALAEGLVFADRLGLPLDAFLEAAKGSAASSQIMDVKGAKMIARDFAPHGKVAQSLKDFHMIVGNAERRGQTLPLAQVYIALMQALVDAGRGDIDNCAIIDEIARRGTP